MNLRKPIVRVLLAVTVVLVLGGYFAFTRLLFDPMEGRYEADVATLVPRNVDFFVAKARLSDDFDGFPRLAVTDEVTDTRAWRTFQRFDYPELEQRYGLTPALEQLQVQLDQMGGIDLLKVFGGTDLALAGYFTGPDLAMSDWTAYGRLNWMGKAAVSLLSFPGLIGLEQQGLAAAVEEDHVALSGGQLSREIYVTRIRDVGIVGTSLEMVRDALELEARGGEDSFGQSANYFDEIEQARRGARRDELELFVDWHAWSEKSLRGGRWPDPESQEFLTAFLGRLFQLGSLKSFAGVTGFDRGVTLDVHGQLSSELMTSEQKRIYRQRGVERAWLKHNAARMARSDSALFLYLQIDLGDLLREILAAAEPALRSNVQDLVRSTGEYNGVDALFDEIRSLFRDRVALIVRVNDYEWKADDPPHNDVPVPAISVILWHDGSELALQRIDDIHNLVVRNQGRLGLKGPGGERGVYTNTIASGHEIWEFWNPLVDGTGHLAAVPDSSGFYVISNHYRMLEDLVSVFYTGGSSHPRLSERIDFRELLDDALPQANVVLWMDPRELSDIRGRFFQQQAMYQVESGINWTVERGREENEVLREQFPGKVRGQLDQDTQDRVDAIVNPRLEALRQRLLEEQVPVIRARLERSSIYANMVSAVLVMLALDPKAFDLTASVVVPLDE